MLRTEFDAVTRPQVTQKRRLVVESTDEPVRQDFEDWAPKVRPGGFLCLHDANHELHTGPRRIVEECIRKDPMWVDGRFVDSMFVTRKAMA